MRIQYETELYHHGILGQKWGVRRYQNKDGSLTALGLKQYTKRRRQAHDLVAKTIPAGTKCYRITAKGEASISAGKDAYVTYLPVDRDNIRSITPWLMSVRNKTMNDAYENDLVTNKDIKLASYEEVAKIRNELMAKEKYREEASLNQTDNEFRQKGFDMQAINDVRSVYTGETTLEAIATKKFEEKKARFANNPEMLEYAERNKEQLISDIANNYKNGVAGYRSLKEDTDRILKEVGSKKITEVSDSDRMYANMVMTAVYGKEGGINKEALRKELQKRGYDGMYDNAMISVDSQNSPEAYEPIIVFDGGKSFTETGGRSLTVSDYAKADRTFKRFQTDTLRNEARYQYKKQKTNVKLARSFLKYQKKYPGTNMTFDEYKAMIEKSRGAG